MPTAAVTMVGKLDVKNQDPAGGPWRLHVVGSAGTSSFHLDEGEHIIGRNGDVSVRVDEDSISRRHARLVIDGDDLSITDLDSMNGVRVRERTIKPNQAVPLSPGEGFELGSIMLVLQRRKVAEKPRRRVYDHGYFENRVDEEIARRAAARSARSEGSGATVRVVVGSGITIARLHIARPDGDGADLDDGVVAEVLEAALPAAVLVAEYAPGELEFMFCDLAWGDVEAACEAVRTGLQARAPSCQLATGVAVFPRDGRTASSLLSAANARLTRSAAGEDPVSDVEAVVSTLADHDGSGVGSGAMDRLKHLVERVADSDISIVIHGETGVGKEVLAREIHRLSPRRAKPFVGLNCAALTETLLESELFGHERGAFSGAVATKPGLFEVAEKGTVFLDEIGEMSPAMQAKLLRVLEERTVLRVGGLSTRPIDVRFLAASHKDLESEVDAGRFRQDLYFRLNGITVEIPPLRERGSELEGLCATFIADACRRNKRTTVPLVSREAMALLSRYTWPGNIRELRNIIERAVLLSSGTRITPEHLPAERLVRHRHEPERGQRHEAHARPLPAAPASPIRPVRPPPPPPDHRDNHHRPLADDDDDDPGTRPAMPRFVHRRDELHDGGDGRDDDMMPTMPATASARLPRADSLKDAVSDLERQRITDALRSCGGNQTKAAELLGISRRTLVNRLDQYELPRPRK